MRLWQNLACPFYHEPNFGKNMADFMNSLENSHCSNYHEVKLAQKLRSFVDATSKSGLPLWSRVNILQKNQEVLIVPFGNLNYPYYHKVKVSTKIGPFLYSLLKIRPSLISQAEISAKIKQFCWGILKT